MTDWVRLRLDVERFDPEPFLPRRERLAATGITLTTIEELGDTAQSRRALYDLNALCSADIPGRGEFYSFEDYVAQRIEVASFVPAGVTIAVTDGRWIGMTATSVHRERDFAFSEMTGVVRDYRRQGLGIALKLEAIDFARSSGVRWLRAFHHPQNLAPITLNRRLGFTDEPDSEPSP